MKNNTMPGLDAIVLLMDKLVEDGRNIYISDDGTLCVVVPLTDDEEDWGRAYQIRNDTPLTFPS